MAVAAVAAVLVVPLILLPRRPPVAVVVAPLIPLRRPRAVVVAVNLLRPSLLVVVAAPLILLRRPRVVVVVAPRSPRRLPLAMSSCS